MNIEEIREIQKSGKNFYLDLATLSTQEREMLADSFSEGSKKYKELMLYLWSNDLETLPGCSGLATYPGHSEEEYKYPSPPSPYMSVSMTKKHESWLKRVIEEISATDLEKLDFRVSISPKNNKKSLVFSYPKNCKNEKGLTESQSNEFFDTVMDIYKRAKENQSTKEDSGNTKKLFKDTITGILDGDAALPPMMQLNMHDKRLSIEALRTGHQFQGFFIDNDMTYEEMLTQINMLLQPTTKKKTTGLVKNECSSKIGKQ